MKIIDTMKNDIAVVFSAIMFFGIVGFAGGVLILQYIGILPYPTPLFMALSNYYAVGGMIIGSFAGIVIYFNLCTDYKFVKLIEGNYG